MARSRKWYKKGFTAIRVEVQALLGEVTSAKCLECGAQLHRDDRFRFYHPRFDYTPDVCRGGPVVMDVLKVNCEILALAESEYGSPPYFDTTPAGANGFKCQWAIPVFGRGGAK